jgi:plastocyanin
MKRVLIVLMFAGLTSCGAGDGPTGGGGGIASVRMVAASISLFPNQTEQLGATALDAAGNPVPNAGAATWRSSNTAVATVTPAGLVTAVAVGSADVSATFGSVSGTTRVAVGLPPLAVTVSMPGLSFSPFKSFLRVTGTVTFEFPQLPHNVIFAQKQGAPADIQTTANVRIGRTFNTVGLFAYDCTLHPGMSGEVEVR